MHSSNELARSSFAVAVDGAPATIDDLFPGFSGQDRLGVVIRDPYGAVGASCLVLAAVTAFYDVQRARSEDFYIYPDYFIFHIGRRLGDHSMLDVWPANKEVVVADDPEEILRAINDRAITRLAVADCHCAEAHFDAESLASARDRVTSAFAYSPAGRVTDADVRITGNDVTESYVNAVLDPDSLVEMLGEAAEPYADEVAARAGEVPDGIRAQIRAQRVGLRDGGRPVETYQRLALEQALALLGEQDRA
jgi:hypothetical protein